MKDLIWKKVWLSMGIIAIILVFYMSLRPVPELIIEGDKVFPFLDKLLHLSCYASLSFGFTQLFLQRFWKWTTLYFIVMGIIIEVLQGTTAYRSFEWEDVLANVTGALLGVFITKHFAPEFLVNLEEKLKIKRT